MIENTDTELIPEPPKKDARETLITARLICFMPCYLMRMRTKNKLSIAA